MVDRVSYTKLEERVTALEVTQEHLVTETKEMNRKLDELIGLKHRGMGAFWLATALVGTGLVSFFNQLIDWVKQ
jgi:hypothetical protein